MSAVPGLAPVVRSSRDKSWISPDAKTEPALLYTSNFTENRVDVYTLTAPHRLVGQLTGQNSPYGECSDTSGHVYITEYAGFAIVEYAHAGKSPIKTLSDPVGYPIGCSVDPKTGDLAVANFGGIASLGPSIAIYRHASGGAITYRPASQTSLWPPTYDDKGNLFVQGAFASGYDLLELPSSGIPFKTISLPFTLGFAGGVFWDGKYVASIDTFYEANAIALVRRLIISHSRAVVANVTEYTDTCFGSESQFIQPAIEGTKLIAGNTVCVNAGSYRIDFWKYAAGGDPTSFVNGAGTKDTSVGQTISTKP